jgi:hypothetical protein
VSAEHWYVITAWGPDQTEKHPAASLSEAWRIARIWLNKGYQVSYSLALVEEIKSRGRAA